MEKKTRPPRTAEQRFQTANRTNIKEAKTLLRNVNKELEKIPKVPSVNNVEMGGDSLRRGLTTLIVGIRRGIRRAKGGTPVNSLIERRNSLRRYLRKAEGMRDSLPPGRNSLTSPRDASDAPKWNK